MSCFDRINFKVSLVIKIINFNGIKKMVPLAMLVIFHVNMITCQNFKLITWYPSIVQNKWNDMLQLPSTFIKI